MKFVWRLNVDRVLNPNYNLQSRVKVTEANSKISNCDILLWKAMLELITFFYYRLVSCVSCVPWSQASPWWRSVKNWFTLFILNSVYSLCELMFSSICEGFHQALWFHSTTFKINGYSKLTLSDRLVSHPGCASDLLLVLINEAFTKDEWKNHSTF